MTARTLSGGTKEGGMATFTRLKEYLTKIYRQGNLDTVDRKLASKAISFATFIPCVAMLLMPAIGWTVTPQARATVAQPTGTVITGTGAPSAGSTGTAVNSDTAVELAAAPKSASEHQLVKVTISTSRTDVTSEGGYGIYADLQNVDTVPLTLRAAETMLVIQPELGDDHRRIFAVNGFYPTEERPDDADKKAVPEIVLQPNEHYVAFWDVLGRRTDAARSTGWGLLLWFDAAPNYLLERLAFVPGNYAFVVVGKTYRNVNGVREQTYHTYTDQVKLHVGLTQIDAMLAAALGGILGYIVVALREGGDFSKYTFLGRPRPGIDGDTASAFGNLKAWLIVGRNMFSAALISAVVTILLSRISDTQFPIKVSVADFWGALTVGFVAYFVGNKLIDRIVGLTAKGNGGGGGNGNAPTEQGNPGGESVSTGRRGARFDSVVVRPESPATSRSR
jgi:hypothetical protein